MEQRKISLKEISKIINTDYLGENVIINGFNNADYNSEYSSVLTYCLDYHYIKKALVKTNFRTIITTEKVYNSLKVIEQEKASYFLVDDPISVFYYLHNYLYKRTQFYSDYDFPKEIGENCVIHKSAIIEDGVIIEDNVTIGANVCIYKGAKIGNNIHIKANTVIGGNGFEVKNISGINKIIQHTGGIKIEDDVDIGSNTCIDKALFEGDTIVGKSTKIDNLVHIAHNNIIGCSNLITAGVITAGSVTIGNNCFIGVGVRISNFVNVGNDVKINIGAVVIRNVKAKQVVAGFYAMPNESWLKKTYEERKKYKVKGGNS